MPRTAVCGGGRGSPSHVVGIQRHLSLSLPPSAMIFRRLQPFAAGRRIWPTPLMRRYSSSADEISDLLARPSWSIESLEDLPTGNGKAAGITSQQLHHLLRLSALPRPQSAAEEAKMIAALESQLHFVQAMQNVDTSGVKPLLSIRDETLAAEQENEFNLRSMKAELDKEEVVGSSGRIVRKKDVWEKNSDHVDPIALAPKTVGRFVVVEKRSQSDEQC